MDRLLKSALTIREIKFRMDDDYIDRLTRQYTVIILICFGFLVSTKQFVGRPITCWCPANFEESHRDYADAICWVSNTYYLPLKTIIPAKTLSDAANHHNHRHNHHHNYPSEDSEQYPQMISYYQWVPLILIFQGLLSFIPCLFWRFLNRRSGVNMTAIMDAARVCSQASYLEIREKAIRYVVNQMDRYLLAQREYRTGCVVRIKHFIAKACCLIGGKLYGNYLISCYMMIKILYVANAVGQLFLLDAFLKIDYHMYGVHIVEKLVRGQDWGYSEKFPRVTLCEFDIRYQSRLHSYVVQCALTINLFNEKLFTFLWFWFVFLAFATAVNFLRWLFRSLYWPGHVQYVRKQIRVMDAAPREAGTLAKFAENYLRRDGMFIVRLIGMNMGEVVAGEVLCGLWNNYSPERRTLAEKPGRKNIVKNRANGGRLEVV
ncbi:hypothetical protein HELRODRAFT_70423 [Helobdella robusta]|uniref:Innexin n=1 Tax=Helobdella robusta TaxID=6412 RepID=T1G065_HELRO|nr:hypothetical protein HELRODRAFT_70423 [Helobdella robusta]ESN91764.1 hypothetical protein HELRODRAFT_70423 [Helobdella robusta]